jgi:5-formaminoimidazole-4-carboxamide-1-(beta)-D-ribofuranosyl 5'-monophosphate synthetase
LEGYWRLVILIKREEMQEIARRYTEPVGVVLGSHSALDALAGLRDYGIRSLVYVTRQRAEIYFREPRVGKPKEGINDLPKVVRRDLIVNDDISDIVRRKKRKWTEAILLVDKYEDVLKSDIQDGILELNGIQIPNRAFAVYVGGKACERIENDFHVPILGSRSLLKIENREEVERNYYWYLEKAGIPHPKEFKYEVREDGIKFLEAVEQPVVLKIPHASRRLERGFIFAANGHSCEEEVKRELAMGRILHEDLMAGRAEEFIPGVTANFNFFYSPINAEENWGELGKYIEGWRLANEFLSIDERRETTHDGILRMLAKEQLKADWSKTRYPISFEVTAHGILSLRESLLRKIYPIADSFVEITQKLDPPGMIGAYCIQTLVTFEEQAYVEAVQQGVYDAAGKTFFDFVIKTQDVAVRHGGGTNVHMGIGSQYANAKYMRPMSMGDRIALEILMAKKREKLDRIVT